MPMTFGWPPCFNHKTLSHSIQWQRKQESNVPFHFSHLFFVFSKNHLKTCLAAHFVRNVASQIARRVELFCAFPDAKLFDAGTLAGAWWQVAWFLLVFLVATPEIHRAINGKYVQRRSGVMQLFKYGVEQPMIQKQLAQLFWGCAWAWSILAVIALIEGALLICG